MATIKFTYNGVDITDSVDILRCWHEMNAESIADSLEMIVDDTSNLWGRWKPQKGDELSIVAGDVKTGTMHLHETIQENAQYRLFASTLPINAKEKRSKAWQDVRLLQMGQEIAKRHNLKFESYSIEDVRFGYKLQDNEHDFLFMSRICTLEGCAFLIYDGTLVMYCERTYESIEPIDTIELTDSSSFRLFDNSDTRCGSCEFVKGIYKGVFKDKSGISLVHKPNLQFSVSSTAEANRYARGLLRNHNKQAYTGFIRFDEIIPMYIPTSVFELKSEKVPSWNGPVFITRVRNDYINDKNKVFFRKTLGGEY